MDGFLGFTTKGRLVVAASEEELSGGAEGLSSEFRPELEDVFGDCLSVWGGGYYMYRAPFRVVKESSDWLVVEVLDAERDCDDELQCDEKDGFKEFVRFEVAGDLASAIRGLRSRDRGRP